MQFYTVIGAIVIAWCGVESARRLNRGVQDDIRVIDAYLSLLRYIRTQIDCYALPIGEIFEKCDGVVLSNCGWKREGAPREFKELFLCSDVRDKTTANIISEFCTDFGRNYRDEELKRCEGCIESLEAERTRLVSEMPNRKKLNLTLCLSASLALIILFV